MGEVGDVVRYGVHLTDPEKHVPELLEGPELLLVRRVQLVESLSLPHRGRKVLILSHDVPEAVRALRAPHRLVGTPSRHMWMIRSLDFVVCEPGKVPMLTKDDLDALVLDDDISTDEVLLALDRIHFGLRMVLPGAKPPQRDRLVDRWMAEPTGPSMDEEFRKFLVEKIPEAIQSPGLGDGMFNHNYCDSKESVAFHDWGDLLGCLPGLIFSGHRSIVVAPSARVPQMKDILEELARHMDWSHLRVATATETSCQDAVAVVGTPESLLDAYKFRLHSPVDVERVLILEADKLVEAGASQQMDLVLRTVTKFYSDEVAIAMQYERHCGEVEDIFKRFCSRDCRRLPRVGLTLDQGLHFYVQVQTECDKLDRLCELLGPVRSRRRISVLCNSWERVGAVAQAMRLRGYEVAATHTGMSPEAVKEEEERLYNTWGMNIVVTNIVKVGSWDVINLELPRSAEEYLQRVGCRRGTTRRRVVVNFATASEMSLIEAICEEHKVALRPMDFRWRKLSPPDGDEFCNDFPAKL